MLARRRGQVGVLHKDRELVTAQPRGRVLVPDGRREPVGDRQQDDVAGRVTQALVDVLEVVEVEGEDGQGTPGLGLPTGQRVVQAVEEQLPVRQSRQRVVEGLRGEVLLEALALGDVADGQDPAPDRRVVAQVDQAALHHQFVAVPVPHPDLERVRVTAGSGEEPVQHRVVLRGHDVEQRTPGQVLGRPAQHGDRGGEEGGGRVRLDHRQDVGAVADQGQESSFARVDHRPLGHPALRLTVAADETPRPDQPARRDDEQDHEEQGRHQPVGGA
jgi:hypothetical protein